MEFVDQHDPELAESLRNQVFVFNDIAYLSDRTIQQILREVDSKDLAIALKGGSEDLKVRIFANVSERVGRMIKEQMVSSGPVPVSDMEEIQKRIVCTVRQLHQAGQITVERERYIL